MADIAPNSKTIGGFRRIRAIGCKRLGALVQRRKTANMCCSRSLHLRRYGTALIASAGCLESQDRINREHELAAAHAIVKRAGTEGVFISHFGPRRDQLGEAVGDSHGPTLVGCRKPRSFALLVDQNVQRAKREEVLL